MTTKQMSFTEKVNRHVQAMAFHMLAFPAQTLEEIVAELLRPSMKSRPDDDAEVVRYLRKPSTQMLLANHWEVGLFNTSGGWRLVSYALPDTPEAARRRLSHRPAGQDQCWYCLIVEKGLGELVPIFDVRGNAIPGVRCHRGGCARSYHRLTALADRPDAPDKKPTKESLL